MAEITSGSFDAANAGFLQLSSDTTRIYYDADLTIDAEGEPALSTVRTDFGGTFTDTLPFTLVTSALAISTTELNTMRNGTIISTNGAAGFGNTADYTFRTACNIDWDNMNFMCSNGLVNGFGVAGSGATVRPLGRVVNSTFGTTAMETPVTASDTFSLQRASSSSAIATGAQWSVTADYSDPLDNTLNTSTNPADWVGGGFIIDNTTTFTNTSAADITQITIAGSNGDVVLTVNGGVDRPTDLDFEITAATGPALTTAEYPGQFGGVLGTALNITLSETGAAMPMGNWFVNLANVDASFVFANNALDAAVLNTAAAGNYVVGLAFAGTVRQQSNNNNSYTIRINSYARAYEGETNVSPWTIMMNNSFANNATTPYAAGVGNDAIAHYETNNVPGGSSILMINEQFEGDAFFAAKRNGTSATFISTYAWNPTFITPASVTIADAKLVGVGSDVIYQVPTGATNRVSTFATQYPTIVDGTIVNSSNGYLVQAGTLVISPNNATSLEGTAARAFADGSLLVTPVTKRAKSYTHLVDTVITSQINDIENSGGSTGAFSFTSEQATTADVDASLVSDPIATVIAYNGAVANQNSGSALYSRLKADWYSEDGLNEPLTDFAGTATAGTISSTHNINLSNTVASASVDATSGIVLPASAGITGDAIYSAISTTGTISVGVPCTNMSLTGSTVTITAVAMTGGSLSGLLDIVDGATFSGVTFGGTLNAFTGTSLDLTGVTFGDSFAATAASGAGKTVIVTSDTAASVVTILETAGWTVTNPAIPYTINFPAQVGNYIIRNNGTTFSSGTTNADGATSVTITTDNFTVASNVTLYWAGAGYGEIVQGFTGMDITLLPNADPNLSSGDITVAGTSFTTTISNGVTTVAAITTAGAFPAADTNRYWNQIKGQANYVSSLVAYRETSPTDPVPLIRLVSAEDVAINANYIKMVSGSNPVRQEGMTNITFSGGSDLNDFTSSTLLNGLQANIAAEGSYTSTKFAADVVTNNLATADDVPTVTEIGTEVDTQLKAGVLTNIGRTT